MPGNSTGINKRGSVNCPPGEPRRAIVMLQALAEKAVLRAVPVEGTVGERGHAQLKSPLRILLAQQDAVIVQQRHKGDVVLLGHGVVRRDEQFVFHVLHPQPLVRVCRLGLQRGQLFAAAGHGCVGQGGDDVAAGGTDVKACFFHISSQERIWVQGTGKQRFHVHGKYLPQPLQQGDVRAALPRFP